jgi:peptidoglycan/xylan/chitin deacetylase (PgdA/CDA1 family)
MERIRQWAGVHDDDRPAYRLMTPSDVRSIAMLDTVAFGAHTRTHPRLSDLTAEAQRAEIVASKSELSSFGWVEHFAYPYGTPSDYTDATVSLVREAGFSTGCSNVGGVVTSRSPRFELPRLFVNDWAAAEFAQHLQSVCEALAV